MQWFSTKSPPRGKHSVCREASCSRSAAHIWYSSQAAIAAPCVLDAMQYRATLISEKSDSRTRTTIQLHTQILPSLLPYLTPLFAHVTALFHDWDYSHNQKVPLGENLSYLTRKRRSVVKPALSILGRESTFPQVLCRSAILSYFTSVFLVFYALKLLVQYT